MRIGFGRDIHRFVEDGRPFVLGGVKIPFEKCIDAEREYAEDYNWEIYDDDDYYFDAGEDGRYNSCHTRLYIEEVISKD